MKRVGLITDDSHLRHYSSTYHPERPERITSIQESLTRLGIMESLIPVNVQPADNAQLALIHTQELIESIRDRCGKGAGWIDSDTYYTPDSFEAARRSAGAVIAAVDRVVASELDCAFCAVRPPGHHAEPDRTMGFCLFNNVAIGAAHAIEELGLDRVAVLDWDGHHGNGTQAAFYENNKVHYTSIHQYPYYPGTGSAEEKGEGPGLGYTLNFPLHAGSGDEEYLAAIEIFWLPEMNSFRPELILVSAGFDAHEADPYVALRVTDRGIEKMTRLMIRAAEKHCDGRAVCVLEGGYDLGALSTCVSIHIRELLR